MSLICTTYIPEGIVLAADSRMTVNMNVINKESPDKSITHIFTASDNSQKVFLLKKVQVGLSIIGGIHAIDDKPIPEFISDFERYEISDKDSIHRIADKLSNISKRFPNMLTIHLAGYEAGEPVFYSIQGEKCSRLNKKGDNIQYGITWSGEAGLIQKMMMAEPKMIIDFKNFNINDCVDFSDFLISTVINSQRFELKPKTCGGPIDILILTRDGAQWYRHKRFDNHFIPIPSSQSCDSYMVDKNGNPIN